MLGQINATLTEIKAAGVRKDAISGGSAGTVRWSGEEMVYVQSKRTVKRSMTEENRIIRRTVFLSSFFEITPRQGDIITWTDAQGETQTGTVDLVEVNGDGIVPLPVAVELKEA